jgi:hypothetical protein
MFLLMDLTIAKANVFPSKGFGKQRIALDLLSHPSESSPGFANAPALCRLKRLGLFSELALFIPSFRLKKTRGSSVFRGRNLTQLGLENRFGSEN